MAVSFDDLVPERGSERAPPAAQPAGGVSFDDLIPGNGERRGSGRDHGIDFSRPVPEVRAAIDALPASQREDALRQWADTYVGAERRERANDPRLPGIGGFVYGLARRGDPGTVGDTVRNVSRGTLVGSWLDEANAYTHDLLHRVSGGRVGSRYDESLAYQRATDRAIDRENPVASVATQVAGGLASGTPLVSVPRTLAGRAALGGGVVGPAHAFVYGSGSSEGDAGERVEAGLSAVPLGVALGAALPVGIAGVARGAEAVQHQVSPTLARWGAQMENLPRRLGIHASADGALPDSPGALASAEQILANQLTRSGVSIEDLRTVLDDLQDARRLNSNSYAQDALALADLDPSLARLAGSATRQSTEAGNIANTFITARQRGVSPPGRGAAGQEELARAGIPTQPWGAPPMTGARATKQLGRNFETPDDSIVPPGQGERLLDAFRRGLRIEDAQSHGHAANAYRTQQAIERNLRVEGNKRYPKAWADAEDFDIAPVLTRLQQTASELNDPAVHSMVRRLTRLFSRADGNGAPLGRAAELKRFDLAKQRLDGLIDRWKGRDNYLYRELTKLKHELLDAVHGGNRNAPTKNVAYSEARSFHFTEKQKQEAIDAGRAAWRGDSDAGTDAFDALEGDALRKFFRLGVYSEAEKAVRAAGRGIDKTALFDNPRIEALLSHIIPRSKRGAAEFADRPERYGRYVGAEQRMITTRNAVQGNSKTAERLADDEAFDALNTLVDTARGGSLTSKALDMLAVAVNKMFGMRADSAQALARMLFTADPGQRQLILRSIEARMGPTRMAVFNQIMRRVTEELGTPVAVRQIPPVSENQR